VSKDFPHKKPVPSLPAQKACPQFTQGTHKKIVDRLRQRKGAEGVREEHGSRALPGTAAA
jgi:hypothetical protein